jgi:anaerobic magnesium-protoporphyrin IX monomethyl ester cyclase
MPDILLIQPPIRDFYLTAKRTLPYGLASIAASLRRAGFTVSICDGLATTKSRIIPWPGDMDYLIPYYGRGDRSPFGLFHQFRHFGYSVEHIAVQARRSGAFLIGISSLFSAYCELALSTAAAVRKACPDATIVLGGHHPSALPETVMDHACVDFVLRGDGEVGMPLLAQALKGRLALSEVPGLVRRRTDGGLEVRPPAVVDDLDRLPIAALDLIQWRHYKRFGKGSLCLAASRGCPLHCTYCAVNTASYHGFRRRSVASVVAELSAAYKIQPMGFIDFEDEHLCADKGWAISLMQQIFTRFGRWRPELRAMNGLYAPSLDVDVLGSMQKAGFKTLNLALITTSVSQLKRFARPDIAFDLDRVLGLARRLHLKAVVYLIIAAPGQDPHESVADLLHVAQRQSLVGMSVFYPAPGSGDFRWCRDHGALPATFGLMRATALPVSHVTNRRQAVTLLRLGRILNFMKSQLDMGHRLPPPAPPPRQFDPRVDRVLIGRILLAAFFHDGNIYGVDADGRLYDHCIDRTLTNLFLKGLKVTALHGAGAWMDPK